MSAKVIKVIETYLQTRGKGVPEDPFRTIKQYWSLDGELLAEVDPYKEEDTIPKKTYEVVMADTL